MNKWMTVACFCILAAQAPALAAGPKTGDVRIDDNDVYPESLDAAQGALYIGSSHKGIVYRALPGSRYAEPWLAAPEGFNAALGIRADPASNTLWVCYNGDGNKASLHSLNLRTGAARGAYDFPGGGLCNDITFNKDAVYATDTRNGRVFRLTKGVFAEWWKAPAADHNMDGIAFDRGGKLYVNSYSTNHILRLDINSDGSPGGATVLATSVPVTQPDGMRFAPNGKLLVAEANLFAGNPDFKLGRVVELTIHGDSADVKLLKDGLEVPAGVTTSGGTLYFIETKFDYSRRAEMKGKDPGAFTAQAMAYR